MWIGTQETEDYHEIAYCYCHQYYAFWDIRGLLPMKNQKQHRRKWATPPRSGRSKTLRNRSTL